MVIEYPPVNGSEYFKGIQLNLKCNKNEPNYRVKFMDINNDIVLIYLESKSGCPEIAFNDIWKYVNKYYYIFGSGCILLGIIECFYGSQLKQFNLFTSGYGAFFCLIMVFLFQ